MAEKALSRRRQPCLGRALDGIMTEMTINFLHPDMQTMGERYGLRRADSDVRIDEVEVDRTNREQRRARNGQCDGKPAATEK